MIKKILFAAGMLSIAAQAVAQKEISLHIGDAAPAIKYSKWLKGTPVTKYNDGRVYVLEFWATWCGPCIAAMPHLSELSDKYRKDATFIGVDVLEKTGDQPYESSLTNVTRFVNSSENRMRYDIIADNNAQDMNNTWLKPAGIQGIPTTFVVRKGKIVWIGHPIKLDSVMDPIIAGTFDVAAYKKKYEERSMASRKSSDSMTAAFKAVKDAVAAKDFNKAFAVIDESVKQQPVLWMVMPMQKFDILLNNFSEAEATTYADTLVQKNKSFLSAIGMAITDSRKELSPATYRYAAGLIRKAGEERAYSGLYDKAALAYNKAGDARTAADMEQKAIEAAQKEVKDPQYAGRVFDYTITDYQARLKEYQQAIK